MKSNHDVLIAFYPNFRGFGYAIFKGAQVPKECGMASIQPADNDKAIRRLAMLIEVYEPKTLIVEETKNTRKYDRVKRLIVKAVDYAKKQKLKVKKVSRDQIKDVFIQFQAHSKYEIAERICGFLPQYIKQMPRFRKPWMNEGYNQGMFDAMSLALTYYYLNEY